LHPHSLPKFDETFLPGTTKWQDCVYAVDKETMSKVTAKLKENKIQNLNFSSIF
jgi:hypothetical protein